MFAIYRKDYFLTKIYIIRAFCNSFSLVLESGNTGVNGENNMCMLKCSYHIKV